MAAMPSEPEQNPADGLPKPRRFWAIAAISFGTALLVLDGAIANVALPTIARDLGVTNAVVTNVVTVYQLVLVMVLLPFSSLGDRIGHRRFYQAGQGLFLVASALCLLAEASSCYLRCAPCRRSGPGWRSASRRRCCGRSIRPAGSAPGWASTA